MKGHIKITASINDGSLVTEVEDTGIGIKEEDKLKLFKFFGKIQHSKKINQGGMGLGLTISKLILQEMKGDIEIIKSGVNQGTIMKFTIPVIEE